jgi:hypothetical protein
LQEETKSRLFIPHYALTVYDIPAVGASWSETVQFAGSFDGYVVFPETQVIQQFMTESRESFARDGSLPEGLTMLRTALFAEQRWDHHGGEDSGGPDVRYVHALVEQIRALVVASANLSPSATTLAGMRDKVMNAYDRLLAGYASWGGYRYYGWGGYEDEANYSGPAVWSERDCDLKLCLELEKEWPGGVHQEFPIAKWTRSDIGEKEAIQRVDVAVLNLAEFVEGPDAATRFGGRPHEVFFEVKWCVKGWSDNAREHKARLEAIPLDIAKLANNLRLGRCRVAGMVIFDDGGWWARQSPDLNGGWPRDVWSLYVGPHALHWRGLAPIPE